ncbi:MAG: hypothetical protein ABEJ78_01320 [Haloferacaceae archaeon]
MAQLLETPSENESATANESATCPTCGGGVVNVQGIHACGTCSWVDPQYC